MNPDQSLRKIVAKLAGVQPDAIDAGFSLQTSALKGSIKRAALAAAIRRDLGVNCPAAHAVTTFGELEHAVFGNNGASPAAVQNTPEPKNNLEPETIPSVPRFTPDLAPATNGHKDTRLAHHSGPFTRATFAANGHASVRCGMDLENVADLPETTNYRDHEFYRDNFTPEEIAYCVLQENPRMHFAARWCAKEALFKCDPAWRNTKFSEIEVVRDQTGEVSLRHASNGASRKLSHAVSLSHTNTLAAAFVVQAAATVEPNPKNEQTTAVPASPAAPAPQSAQTPALLETEPDTDDYSTFIWALAWLVAIGIGAFALVRTYR
jgi:phosphopantetheine--protein transferase-like protein